MKRFAAKCGSGAKYKTANKRGKGSGLGLSMVHGFIKQSGGNIAIYSEPGEGTSLKLYLPRSREQEEDIKKPLISAPQGGQETILVVEDDEDVRHMTVRILKRLGYRVLEAEDGRTTLAIIGGEDHVDLLLCDVVLPGGMNGPEIARAVRDKAPGVKVLYMSGYTENAIVHHGRVDEGAHLIGKPFSHIELGAKVRETLDNLP